MHFVVYTAVSSGTTFKACLHTSKFIYLPATITLITGTGHYPIGYY